MDVDNKIISESHGGITYYSTWICTYVMYSFQTIGGNKLVNHMAADLPYWYM